MKVTKNLVFALCMVGLLASAASAQSFRWDQIHTVPSSNLPAGSITYRLYATTAPGARLISWQDVQATVFGGTLFNDAAGSNSAAPNPILFPVFPALAADSWANMQGNSSTSTSVLTNDPADTNNPFDPPTGIKLATWGDTAATTAETERMIAQLTLIPNALDALPCLLFSSGGLFMDAPDGGTMLVPGSDLTNYPMGRFNCPEPGNCLLVLCGCLSVWTNRRRS